MTKSLIVLLIDHDTFASEEPGEKFTKERLIEQGKLVNDDAASILGYEAWMILYDAPADLVENLNKRNLPLNADTTKGNE